MTTKKTISWVTVLLVAAMLTIGFGATNAKVPNEKKVQNIVWPPPDLCLGEVYLNETGATQTLRVEATDDCPGSNSWLTRDGVKIAKVFDGTTRTFNCVTLAPGQVLGVQCHGDGSGFCPMEVTLMSCE